MQSEVLALLGPTNTGKTHRAIERMLEHDSGMIGLPLRLLAREVYDRVTARVGESRVALVTGEEQRIPPRPSYWISTVEAMPVEREVDFVAIDEVQLAAHDQRGHVFTSRILGARGRKETWFLGADTMRRALRDLAPTAKAVEHPRLSRLAYSGAATLARIPPRSAVVAFAMPHVYEIADKLRARRGGAAVVLGALSPRTRNAQVAMFQAGEVDWLVATDAIGMGLNLDVRHVAFAAHRKFDGRDVREVEDAELAQIAGRAGRYVQDGSFGTLAPLELASSTVHAIETHAFPSIRRVRWRNDDLDFSSIAELRASLAMPAPRPIFRFAGEADDAKALALLGARDSIAKAARGRDGVRLLWDVCTIPDFRKLLFEAHAEMLGEIFETLALRGRLDDDFMAERVHDLQNTDGDVDTLVARIATTRTWTYVANRAAWLVSPGEWQERTRMLEDELSDALHQRLVMRFVDARRGRATSSPRKAAPSAPASAPRVADWADDRPSAPGHPFAKLAALRDALAPSHDKPPSTAASAWVEDVVAAPHDDLRLRADARIVHVPSDRVVGALLRGPSVALPDVRILDDDLGAGARSRLQRRLLAFARDAVSALLGGADTLATRSASAALRGLVFRLGHGLGTIVEETPDLPSDERLAIEHAGVRFGAGIIYVGSGLDARAIEARVALVSVFFGNVSAPTAGTISFVPKRGDGRAFAAIGFPIVAGRAIRADALDKVTTRLRSEEEEAPEDAVLASWLACKEREVTRIVRALRA